MKCKGDINTVKRKIYSLIISQGRGLLTKEKSEESNTQALQTIFNKIREEIINNYEFTDDSIFNKQINESIQNMVSKLYPIEKYKYKIPTIDFTKVTEKTPTIEEDTSINILEKNQVPGETEDSKPVSEFNRDYLTDFKTSPDTNKLAIQQINNTLLNSFIYNIDNGYTVTPNKLADSIADYQSKLYKNLIDFLNLNKLSETQKEQLNKITELFTVGNTESKVYTGNFEKLKQYFASYFKPQNLVSLQTKANAGDTASKYILNSYINYMILDNFSSIIKDTFGKAININDDLQDLDYKKYSLSELGTNIYSSWRTTDEVNLGNEINKLVQLIVVTTPLYKYGGEQTENYITFNQFNYVMSNKLKTLSNYKSLWNTDIFNLIKTNITENQFGNNFNDLEKLILEKIDSFGELMCLTQRNPQRYYRIAFEILNNENSYNMLFKELKIFNTQDKDILYSVYKRMFDNSNSIYRGSIGNQNWYSYITQVIDTINGVKYLQYFQDQNGVKLRELVNSSLDNTKRGFGRTINNRFYNKDIKNQYNVVNNTEEYKQSDGTTILVPNKITFNLSPNIQITQGKSILSDTQMEIGEKNIYKVEDYILKIKDKEYSENEITWELINDTKNFLGNTILGPIGKFIYNTLGIDLSNEKELNGLMSISSEDTQFPGNLLKLASTVIYRTNINQFYTEDSAGNKKYFIDRQSVPLSKSRLALIYGKTQANKSGMFDSQLGPTINVISTLGPLNQFLDLLATAKAYSNGILSSVTVKTGENKTLSQQALSSLDCTYRSQWSILKQDAEDSASRNFSLIKPGILTNVSNIREFVTQNGIQKNFIQFTPAEMFTGLFLHNFLNPLYGDQHIVNILGAVNSDKPKADMLSVNLDEIPLGQNESYLEILKSSDWKDKLSQLFLNEHGEFYKTVVTNINNDFKYLLGTNVNYIFNGLQPQYTQEYFDKFNNYAMQKGIGGYDLLMQEVKSYNNSHRNNPIVFTDQMHYIKRSDSINNRIYNNIEINSGLRYTSDITFANKDNIKSYLKDCEEQLFSYLIKDNAKIKYLEDNGTIIFNPINGWGSNSGYLTLAKITIDGVTTNISQKSDVYKLIRTLEKYKLTIKDFYNIENLKKIIPEINIEVNPDLAKYNDFGFLISQEWRSSLVGTHFAHPSKAKTKSPILFKPKNTEQSINFDDFFTEYSGLLYSFLPMEGNDKIITEIWKIAKNKASIENKILYTNNEYVYDLFKNEFNPDETKAINKLKYNRIANESSRFDAQHKRNVSYTATMHLFQLNQLNGVPEEANIAIIEEDFDLLYNIVGQLDNGVSPYDGATFVHPLMKYIENNSLNGAKVGTNKKIFVHYYDKRTGSGGIIKTAGFALTNNTMRMAKFDMRLARNMMDRPWVKEDGSNYVVDLTKDNWNGEKVNINGLTYEGEDGKIYKILGMESVGNNKYIFNIVEQLNDADVGEPISTNEVLIDTNYKLWKALGGTKSCSFNGKEYIPSEDSLNKTVEFMNTIGEYKADILTNLQENENLLKNANITQDEIYQPLKHSDLLYMPVVSSVKQGAGNINSSSAYKEDDDTDYGNPENINFMKIHLLQSGIQLDKEHSADDEDISLMTQVISACSSRGYSQKYANRIYNALTSLVNLGLKEQLQDLSNILESNSQDLEGLQKAVCNIIMENMLTKKEEDSDLLSQIIAQDIVKYIKQGKKVDFENIKDKIPYSDSRIYKKLVSVIHVALTNSCIKLKIPGILSVLCPSYNRIMLYGDKMLNDFKNQNELLQEQKKYNALPLFVLNKDSRISQLKDKLKEYNLIKTSYLNSTEESNPLFESKENSISDAKKSELEQLKNSKISISKKINALLNSGNLNEDQIIPLLLMSYKNKLNLDSVNKDVTFSTSQKKYFSNKSPNAITLDKLAEDIEKFLENDYKITPSSDVRDKLITSIQNFNSGQEAVNTLIDSIISQKQDPVEEETNRKIEELEENIAELEKNTTKPIDVTYKLECGHWYNVTYDNGEQETFLLDHPFSNYEKDGKIIHGRNSLLQDIKNEKVVKITEDITHGRNLGHYNILFSAIDEQGNTHNLSIYDLTSSQLLFELSNSDNKQNKIDASKLLQNDLMAIKNKGTIRINGVPMQVTSVIEEHPAEVILPKTMKSKMGLSDTDTLAKIKSDENFFTNKALQNFKDTYKNYDVALKRFNGNHMYIADMNNFNPEGLVEETIYKFYDPQTKQLWRVNKDGDKKLYLLSPRSEENPENDDNDDKLYSYYDKVTKRKYEVLVTKNIKFHIQNANYQQLVINPNIKNKNLINAVVNLIPQVKSLRQQYSELSRMSINKQVTEFNTINNYLYTTDDLNIDDLNKTQPSIAKHFKYIGNRQRASFFKLLEVVAARIPAQSMQSFMPMRIVGFDNSDTNTAYVSTSQIWLQGSDYDIDSVSMTNYELTDSGEYQTWTPLADIRDLNHLKASDEFPLPTGKELMIQRTVNIPSEDSKTVTTSTQTGRPDFHNEKAPEYVLNIDNLVSINKFNGKYFLDFNNTENIKEVAKFIDYLNNNDIYNIKFVDTEGSEDSREDKFEFLIKKIDEHNTYFNNLDKKAREKAVINYMLTNMYAVAIDPSNQIEASTPLDKATGPVKKIANNNQDLIEEQNEALVGNTEVTVRGIRKNQVGKTGVGICAVGLKSFFAATQAINNILSSGTDFQKSKAFFNIRIKGKTYTTLSNVFADKYKELQDNSQLLSTQEVNSLIKNLKILKNKHIKSEEDIKAENETALKLLLNTDQTKDSAIVLSALLSLATDNAKELALAKLNAGSDMLGMYIFGIVVGADVQDISKILTSPTALAISDLIESNIFLNEKEISLSGIKTYSEKGPIQLLPKDSISNKFYKAEFKADENNSSLDISKRLASIDKNRITYQQIDAARRNIPSFIEEYLKYKNLSTEEINLKKVQLSIKLNRTLDIFENYLNTKELFTKENLQDFMTLYKGSSELRRLGEILHVNQGLYTTISESQNYISKITDLIQFMSKISEASLEQQQNALKINIHEFINNPDYQKKVINAYEEYKVAINIPLIISSSLQYTGYLKVVDLSNGLDKISARNRCISENVPKTNISKKEWIKRDSRLNRCITENMVNLFFRKENLQFLAPKNSQIYINGKLSDALVSPTTVLLGNEDGNASFKRWIEEIVIPKLQRDARYKRNKFINSLDKIVLIDNLSDINSIVYSLPTINLSPRSEEDDIRFKEMQQEFLKLNPTTEGDGIYTDRSGNSYGIQDLLFMYNLITTQNTPGEFKLTNIFSKSRKEGLMSRFTKYENEFDRTRNVKLSQNILNNIDIPRENPYISSSPTVIWRDNSKYKKVKYSRVVNNTRQFDENEDFEDQYADEYDDEYSREPNIIHGMKTNYTISSEMDSDNDHLTIESSQESVSGEIAVQNFPDLGFSENISKAKININQQHYKINKLSIEKEGKSTIVIDGDNLYYNSDGLNQNNSNATKVVDISKTPVILQYKCSLLKETPDYTDLFQQLDNLINKCE